MVLPLAEVLLLLALPLSDKYSSVFFFFLLPSVGSALQSRTYPFASLSEVQHGRKLEVSVNVEVTEDVMAVVAMESTFVIIKIDRLCLFTISNKAVFPLH